MLQNFCVCGSTCKVRPTLLNSSEIVVTRTVFDTMRLRPVGVSFVQQSSYRGKTPKDGAYARPFPRPENGKNNW